MPDSDQVACAVLLQGDDVADSSCDACLRPAEEWPHMLSYHPLSRPGAIYRGALYCADCKPRAYNDAGLEVRTFCGNRHTFTDGENTACGCFN